MENREITFFRIGDVVLKVVSDLSFPLPIDNSDNFRIPEEEQDYTFCFRKTHSLPELVGENKVVGEIPYGFELQGRDGEHYRAFTWRGRIYDALLRLDRSIGIVSYINDSIMLERCKKGFNFINYFGLEYLFLRFGGLFLHSSHINVGGRALLFSAPSGTGKSTQAALWQEHAGAEIINGDRSLLRKKDGVWHAYGCPMCGTSGIHKQGNEPIHAIVMLSQGTENSVRRLGAGEAFQRMYPEITVPKWNRELVLRAMELLDDVMANVPIYAFSCTKDESAVTALREALGL